MSGDLQGVVDYFTPMDMASLDKQGNDLDFGSGGILLIPERGAASPHMAVATGKKGDMFLLIEENLGKFDTKANHVFAKVDWPVLVTASPLFRRRRWGRSVSSTAKMA